MIKPGEIQKIAHKEGVRDQQIEKDYILSWILWGISTHEELRKNLAFKGGTVLKKVYFEEHRFSEDLDFTLLNDDLGNEKILEDLSEMGENIREEANIPLDIDDDKTSDQKSLNLFLNYTGPLGGQGKRIKVDISRTEKMEWEPIQKAPFQPYSDLKEHSIRCYTMEEVLVEKLRSVMQRMEPRDLYDIWYLLEVRKIDLAFLENEFRSKCEHMGKDPRNFHDKLEERMPQYEGRWTGSLSGQIQELPDFGSVRREVIRNVKTLDV